MKSFYYGVKLLQNYAVYQNCSLKLLFKHWIFAPIIHFYKLYVMHCKNS